MGGAQWRILRFVWGGGDYNIEARNTKTGRNNLSKLWGKFGFKVEGGGG